MNRQLTEARVIEIVERVAGGGLVEDNFVECKSRWPDPTKAARQIAALANSARGDAVIWLVGLDENKHEVIMLDATEPADWWNITRRRFAEDFAPELTLLNVPTQFGPVMCLHFETDRAPYLVTTNGADRIEREVPWREGNSTRSARRSELLSLLAASVKLPTIDWIEAIITLGESRVSFDGTWHDTPALELHASLFVDTQNKVLLPKHLWQVEFSTVYGTLAATDVRLSNMQYDRAFSREDEHPNGVVFRIAGAVVNGPDGMALRATAPVSVDALALLAGTPIDVTATLPVSGTPQVIRLTKRLDWNSDPNRQTITNLGYPSRELTALWIAQTHRTEPHSDDLLKWSPAPPSPREQDEVRGILTEAKQHALSEELRESKAAAAKHATRVQALQKLIDQLSPYLSSELAMMLEKDPNTLPFNALKWYLTESGLEGIDFRPDGLRLDWRFQLITNLEGTCICASYYGSLDRPRFSVSSGGGSSQGFHDLTSLGKALKSGRSDWEEARLAKEYLT